MYSINYGQVMSMDINKTEELNLAVAKAVQHNGGNTIGLLSEKTLHSALKFYFCEDSSCHEIKFNGYVADILINNGDLPHIMEIQTKYAYRLAKKLNAYGEDIDVTVVIPIMTEKKICWIDPVSGNVTLPRKTPKHRNAFHALCEMYGIRDYICKNNITVCIVLLKCTEYKLCDGYGDSKKIHATKYDIVPEEMVDEIWLSEMCDFDIFRVFDDNVRFTCDEFAKAAKMTVGDARYAMLTLVKIGLIEECGKNGRKKLWRYTPNFTNKQHN